MLNINKNLNGETLTVSLEGRLDTTTAPQLEESLKESMVGIKELILDFANLEYISSAGLRVLLSAQKNMAKQGSMKLIHVSDVIMEIFEVTGQNQIFRQKSLDQISSPEQLHDYLHVTNPTVWLALAAVILLLVGCLIWVSAASNDVFASATATVNDGSMVIQIDDPNMAKTVKSGMRVLVSDTSVKVASVGHNEDGTPFAVADTTLADGSYPARVVLGQGQVIRLLFN